jgi:DNA-binding MarR family transcriptional regulator
MDYIANTLGVKIATEPWGGSVGLPFHLTDAYAFQTVTLDSVKYLFVKPTGKLASLPALRKHLGKIAERAATPLVLELPTINARQRNALIAARIPFVVEGKQLYLPFLGAVLQERYDSRNEQGKTLSPSAQLTLVHYLYQGEREMRANGLANLLGLSAMQITRAIRQLAALELVTTRKDGVQIVIAGTANGKALFEKARPHLQSPVRKRFFVEKETLPPKLPLAGLSALSEFSMLNPPDVATYAFDGKTGELSGTDTLVDADAQTEIEVWRYLPTLLSRRDGLPDPLSLWTSLPDGDARVEIAKDNLLADVWGKK